MKPNLIGLAGYARAGKNTVGDYLTARHGYAQRAFADKLRELALACDPMMNSTNTRLYSRYSDVLDVYGYEGAKNDYPEVRDFLVRLGAGARKVLGGDVWLDACLPLERNPEGHAFSEADGGKQIVVTDVRYPNEAARIVELGGQVWYVRRDGVRAANDEEQRSIAQVLNAPGMDVKVLLNSGTIADLHESIERLLR